MYYVYSNTENTLLQTFKYNKMHLIAIFRGIVIIYEHNIQNMEIQLWIKMIIKTKNLINMSTAIICPRWLIPM